MCVWPNAISWRARPARRFRTATTFAKRSPSAVGPHSARRHTAGTRDPGAGAAKSACGAPQTEACTDRSSLSSTTTTTSTAIVTNDAHTPLAPHTMTDAAMDVDNEHNVAGPSSMPKPARPTYIPPSLYLPPPRSSLSLAFPRLFRSFFFFFFFGWAKVNLDRNYSSTARKISLAVFVSNPLTINS